jgi:hypothetical protein
MTTSNDEPAASAEATMRWAPRVQQHLIRRLYESDARGLLDEELLNEVGWGLYARCESFIQAVEAAHGRATCPGCGKIVLHSCVPEEVLRCANCGWQTTWQTYFRSFQHKQLSGAEPVLVLFRQFMAHFPLASSPSDKMLLIDRLIHGFHQSLGGDPTRTTGVNLIEGRHHEVVEFLDSLAYGDGSTRGTVETLEEWRGKINQSAEAWGTDEHLRSR